MAAKLSSMLARDVSLAEVAAYVGDAVETIVSTYTHFVRGSESRARHTLDLALADDLDDRLRHSDATRPTLREV